VRNAYPTIRVDAQIDLAGLGFFDQFVLAAGAAFDFEGIENRPVAQFVAKICQFPSQNCGEQLHSTGDPAQTVRAVIDRVHRSHNRQ
jgi:hypothetical protein